ncbi:chemotaxis protein CheW [Solemya pervernicosa gill symbiont]|uniref:Chemotaxis protein CheW n=2 Tax=Gammaproteobacteria incertae sedis TaxID=118884 RepID=A0A1T2L8Y3_9GAMM|nr:chemotaxis protein CheV [Candidatus Reidiella endopervernicosa]OOZ41494.1 chemotaxis protein CheW [Solemya pervernicosa gill symbiont]QKQ27308.1 chemotaxis protein CheV [Candidatus Reidiella endopervernicosa]
MAGIMDGVDQRTQLAGHNRLELLMFRLGARQRFGINVFKVQEVIQCPALTSVPHSHPVIRGVANLRGNTIPLVDLGMAIKMKPIDDLKEAFVIITEFNRTTIGFLVSSVDRIINTNWEDILPPPKGMSRGTYLTAVTRVDDELVEIIDVEKVLAEVMSVSEEISQEVLSDVDEVGDMPHHVLIADDSSVARNQVKRTLDQIGVETTLANDGKQALDILLKWAEDEDPKLKRLAMVLSDIEMPEMDGYTLTTSIRNDPRLTGLYVLLHSSLSGVFNNAMVEKVGANKFIAKFKPDELAGAVLDRIKAVDNA